MFPRSDSRLRQCKECLGQSPQSNKEHWSSWNEIELKGNWLIKWRKKDLRLHRADQSLPNKQMFCRFAWPSLCMNRSLLPSLARILHCLGAWNQELWKNGSIDMSIRNHKTAVEKKKTQQRWAQRKADLCRINYFVPHRAIKCLPIGRVNLDLDSTGNLHDFQRKLSTRHIVSLRAGEALGRQSWDLWMPLVTKLLLNFWILWKPFWNARLDTSSGTLNLQPVCPVMFLVFQVRSAETCINLV